MSIDFVKTNIFLKILAFIYFISFSQAEASNLSQFFGASSGSKPPLSQTFFSDGTWVVPAGVTKIAVSVIGAGGGAGGTYRGGGGGGGGSCIKAGTTVLASANGGNGGSPSAAATGGERVSAFVDVVPGSTLNIYVGGGGGAGSYSYSSGYYYSGGGGGYGVCGNGGSGGASATVSASVTVLAPEPGGQMCRAGEVEELRPLPTVVLLVRPHWEVVVRAIIVVAVERRVALGAWLESAERDQEPLENLQLIRSMDHFQEEFFLSSKRSVLQAKKQFRMFFLAADQVQW